MANNFGPGAGRPVDFPNPDGLDFLRISQIFQKTSGSSSSSLKSELLENPAELLGSIIEDTISLAEDKSRSVSESTVTGVSSGGS